MRKLDIHTHVTLYPDLVPVRKSDGHHFLSLEDQLAVFENANIGMGVLLPLIAPECQWHTISNQEAKIIADQYPDKFVWFCNVDPRAGSYSADTDLEHIVGFYKSLGARGLGELTSTLCFDDPMMDNLFTVCERLNMPVLFHIAPRKGGSYGVVDEMGLPGLEKALKKHPDLKFIGHSTCFWSELSADVTAEIRSSYPKGKVQEGRIGQLMRTYGNLYCDLSAGSGSNAMMRDPEYAARFMEEFADRICYGTDVCSPKQVFYQTFDQFLDKMVADNMLSQANYEKIIYYNTAKLIGIEK